MVAFTIVMLVLSLLVIIATWYYLRMQNGDSKNINLKPQKKKQYTLKDVIEIQDVQNNMAILPNNTYCAICRLSSPDFFLLDSDSQEHIENVAAGVLIQLNFPVQFLVTAESLDTRSSIIEIKDNMHQLSPVLRELAQARAEYLEALMRDQLLSARQAYMVLSYSTDGGIKQAYIELQARMAAVASILAGAKIGMDVLQDSAIIDLVSHLLNRNRFFRPSEALKEETITSFHATEKLFNNPRGEATANPRQVF